MRNVDSGPPAADNDNDYLRFYVYAWLYPDGRPFYVGKGCGRRDVFPKTNVIFKRIVAKIREEGKEPRIVRWQEGLRESDAFSLEMAYIKLFGRRDNGTGVLANLTDGGEGMSGHSPSKETRKKMGAWQIGKSVSAVSRAKISAANSGRKPGDDTRLKMSSAKLGRKHSVESREKIRVSHLGKRFSEDHRANLSEAKKNPSAETRAKIGAAHRGKSLSAEHLSAITNMKLIEMPKGDFKGVNLDKDRGKYLARIKLDGKQINLGRFTTPEAAARVYDKAAFAAWGAECYLNFPNEIST
ncbi:NUMOD3 domain-containing DNA-binding protein [Rhizobium leucaenae]|uniref:NUMOD3 domain-containing DNA-binding protein n=1 Tax=Rhizobium leucaenae TaxID=29450 RepID=UPI00055ACABA|nr:NUMOD3 domain-containing DNA-binding protein [Rhizobium leucaenae]MBB6299913.1 hypothetical protein [Rhizobium leucaenae]